MTQHHDDTSPADGQADDTNGSETPGWNDAMGELSSILAELERDDLDLDVLADRVERAAWLIGVCRERIAGTRLRVDELVADLNPEAPVA
ncbi:MAG: exodeoxyribonuclease VII small subunit [Microthrixaceae bacterium]